MVDFSALSDDELAATILLLGEQAQEITNATTCVRQEQQRRAIPPPVSPETLSEVAMSALSIAVSAAPARAKELIEVSVAETEVVNG